MSLKKRNSVVGLLIVDNKILLLKRHSYDRTLPNVYCLPGGKRDDSDFNDFEALTREFKEETNILIRYDARLFRTKENDKFIIGFYIVSTNDLDIKLSDEHETYIWMDLQDLDLYKDQIAPLTLSVLYDYMITKK